MPHVIYADNAATSALASEALEAMLPFLTKEYGNASQPYSFSRAARKALQDSRDCIAQCLNADPHEIFFTSGGSESNNWALKGIAVQGAHACDVLTSTVEHHAVLNVCASINHSGGVVHYLPVNSQGVVNASDCSAEFVGGFRPVLVSVMLANNEVGSIQPVAELCAIAHQYGARFHTDAVQAIGHIPVDVRALGVDLLSASAHKFNGPKGIGFLYKRYGLPLNQYIHGGAQEYGMRAGTENVASIVGMAAALKLNCSRMANIAVRLNNMEQLLCQSLRENGITFYRNGASEHVPGNVSLSFPGAEGEMLLHRLDFMGICVSTGSACDSRNTQVSHVLRAMGIDERIGTGTIRISFGAQNTEKDALTIAQAVSSILKG